MDDERTSLDAEFPLLSQSYDDVCWEMVMRCEQTEDGFEAPPIELVAEYAQRYPEHADELIDFAATCRTEDFMVTKYPLPEPDEVEIKRATDRYMRMFRKALRHVNAEARRKVTIGNAEYDSWKITK